MTETGGKAHNFSMTTAVCGTGRKRAGVILILFLIFRLSSLLLGEERYRLNLTFSGQARGTILVFFRFRFCYEAFAALELSAVPSERGGLEFRLEKLLSPAYVLRTLGFSGKGLALAAAFDDPEILESFGRERIERWKKEKPEFSRFLRRTVQLPHAVENVQPSSLGFRRSTDGRISEAASRLQLRRVHHSREPGIYFHIYDLLSETLGLCNHGVWPDSRLEPPSELPRSWISAPVDLSAPLNRAGGQTEKIVSSAVEFQQEAPFVMAYRIVFEDDAQLEILGENRRAPKIWKRFRIDGFRRRIRVRKIDLLPLRDELELEIQNGRESQGGRAHLLLERVSP